MATLQYMVHRFYSEKYDEGIVFKGTEEECIEYINNHLDMSLELYWEEKKEMGFNDWLLEKYGITSDDMTDEDYDDFYAEYEDWKENGGN